MADPTPSSPNPIQPPSGLKFDPALAHHLRPKIRPLRGFPMQGKAPNGDDVTLLGLADARQVTDKIVATLPPVQHLLPHMQGDKTVDEIVAATGRGVTKDFVQNFVAQLDDAGLLFGPKFDEILADLRRGFDSSDVLPPGSSAALADAMVVGKIGQDATEEQKREQGPIILREALDTWIAKALEKVENPALDALPKAIIAPHIDYQRGWMNYGNVWGRLRVVDRPDRVVILGTNHFGFSTGVAGCDKGFSTPLGVCKADTALLDAVKKHLGTANAERLMANRYDHEQEHSIELQIPWIQHVLGKDDAGEHCPVLGFLIHDPAANNGESYDGQGLAFDPFLAALKAAIAELGGKTLIVSSADLSHVGPAFGDPTKTVGNEPEIVQFRDRVVNHDREMIELLRQNKPDEMVASMAWQQNPTRWCSIGNLTATLRLVEPERIDVLNYAAAVDQQGMTMVSSMAAVMA